MLEICKNGSNNHTFRQFYIVTSVLCRKGIIIHIELTNKQYLDSSDKVTTGCGSWNGQH